MSIALLCVYCLYCINELLGCINNYGIRLNDNIIPLRKPNTKCHFKLIGPQRCTDFQCVQHWFMSKPAACLWGFLLLVLWLFFLQKMTEHNVLPRNEVILPPNICSMETMSTCLSFKTVLVEVELPYL